MLYLHNKGYNMVNSENMSINNLNNESISYKIDESDIIKNNQLDEDIEEKRMSITTRGLSGLVNLGNTCYMNSIFQCLSNLPMFGAYFREKRYYNNLLKNCNGNINDTISEALSRLLLCMWECNYRVKPEELHRLIPKYNSIFAGHVEQDSQELLNFLFDKIHDEVKTKVNVEFDLPEVVNYYINIRNMYLNSINNKSEYPIQKADRLRQKYNIFKKNNIKNHKIFKACDYWAKYVKDSFSIITKLFTGLEYGETICPECGNISSVFQPFNTISLALPSSYYITEYKLEQCLADYSKEEILDCEYNCSKCKKAVIGAKKTMYIWEPPEILILYLKRFNYGRKIDTKIDIPLKSLKLDMCYSPYYNNDITYDLSCVSTHVGSSMVTGHYTAFCKNSLNNLWYCFDDSRVIHVPDEYIKQDISDCYILFYVKSVDN